MKDRKLLASFLVLSWTLACKYDQDRFRTPTDASQAYVQVSADASEVAADGFSTVGLTARISPDAAQRQIKFTASLGQMVGGSGTPSSITVTADGTGTARATLKTTTDIGVATVTVEVVGVPSVTTSVQIAVVAADPDAVIRFTAVPASALADGTAASVIAVAVAARLPQGAGRKVTLTTNLGSFSPTSQLSSFEVTPSQVDNSATVLLYSPQEVGLAVVTAEVAGVKRSTVLSFERALPQSIRVDLSAITIQNSANNSLTVTGVLTRSSGKVSRDTRATFEARDADGSPFGRFLQQDDTSDADGKVSATFSPAGSGKPGTATLIVRVEGTDATGTATFQVTPAS